MFDAFEFSASLGSDNHSGVHPQILKALEAVNRGHAPAYGIDKVSLALMDEMRRVFGEQMHAELVFNGTAANVLSLSPWMRSHHAVICADVAHLNVDECGAPEKFLGAKLWALPTTDGLIYPEQAKDILSRRGDQHFSQARMVSLTLPNEFGVCYSLAQLEAWRDFCLKHDLKLHIDGARLANACVHLDLAPSRVAELADVISFGGTKNGLLGAEAVVFTKPGKDLAAEFKFTRKQAMQLPSKTRFLSAQLLAYLKDDLYLKIAHHVHSCARDLARRIAAEVPEIELAYPIHSNALFVRVPKAWLKPLREQTFFYIWDSDLNLCRWMISWDWTDEMTTRWLNQIKEVRACFPAE